MQHTGKQLSKWELLAKNGLYILRKGLILFCFFLEFFLHVIVSHLTETGYTPDQPHSNSSLH